MELLCTFYEKKSFVFFISILVLNLSIFLNQKLKLYFIKLVMNLILKHLITHKKAKGNSLKHTLVHETMET
jgi:hypothetical protein